MGCSPIHPDRKLPRVSPIIVTDRCWLSEEEQAFIKQETQQLRLFFPRFFLCKVMGQNDGYLHFFRDVVDSASELKSAIANGQELIRRIDRCFSTAAPGRKLS
jgi:hypothetical protein